MEDFKCILNDAEAAQVLAAADLSEAERRRYRTFLTNFQGAPFVRAVPSEVDELEREAGQPFPAWFRTHLLTLYGAFTGEVSVQFQAPSKGMSPVIDDGLPELRFSVGYSGWHGDESTVQALRKAAPGVCLYPIGYAENSPGVELAVNLARKRDTTIYSFHLEDIEANVSEGEAAFASVYPVFRSPGDMLALTSRILHDGVTTPARRD